MVLMELPPCALPRPFQMQITRSDLRVAAPRSLKMRKYMSQTGSGLQLNYGFFTN
jgi:hypothetical protein